MIAQSKKTNSTYVPRLIKFHLSNAAKVPNQFSKETKQNHYWQRIGGVFKKLFFQSVVPFVQARHREIKDNIRLCRDKFREIKKILRMKKRRLITHSELVQKTNSTKYILCMNSEIKTNIPRIINNTGIIIPRLEAIEMNAPPVGVFLLKNAKVVGGSNMVFHKKYMVHHDLFQFETDYTSEELHRKYTILPERNLAFIHMRKNTKYKIQSAATFLDAGSRNYAHWLTEVLPRVLLFIKNKEYESIPLLIDSGLHENIMSSLKCAVDLEKTCYLVDNEVEVLADKLYVTNAASYVPFEPRPDSVKCGSHGVFNKHAIDMMRKTFIPAKAAKGKKSRRIFIKRGQNIRAIKNEDKIIGALKTIGFEIIEPEKLSFQDQVKTFSNADVIVGASGAALANLIFSPAEAKNIILAAANPLLKYGYWQNLVQTFGGQISYILGHPESSNIHSAFTINMQILKKEISKCLA